MYRVSGGGKSPNMCGRILGCATNKYLSFIADTGSPIALVPRSVAIRNKLDIYPPDSDENSYAGASGTELTVIGSPIDGIARNFRTRVFVSGFYYFLNTGSLLIPQVWGKTNSLYFSPRKKLKIEIHV